MILPPSLPPFFPNFHPPILYLYLHTGAIPVEGSLFSPSSGPVFLDNVDCEGSETELLECADLDLVECDEDSHAGVICPCK